MPTSNGTIAITARGDGSRWYGRISITVELAQKISLNEGDRVSTRYTEEGIVIYPDENGRIRIPSAKGKNEKKHAFEAATTTLGLKEIRLPQQPVVLEVIENTILVRVPPEYLSGDSPRKRRPRKKSVQKNNTTKYRREVMHTITHKRVFGSVMAIVTEAGRSGKKIRPMNLKQIIELLLEHGQDVQVLGRAYLSSMDKA